MARVKKLTKSVGVVLTDDQHEKLKQVTDEMEISKSEYVRNVILEMLKKHEGGMLDNDLYSKMFEYAVLKRNETKTEKAPLKSGEISESSWIKLFTTVFLSDFILVKHSLGKKWNPSNRDCFKICANLYFELINNEDEFWKIEQEYADKLNELQLANDLSDKYIVKKEWDMSNRYARSLLIMVENAYKQKMKIEDEAERGDKIEG